MAGEMPTTATGRSCPAAYASVVWAICAAVANVSRPSRRYSTGKGPGPATARRFGGGRATVTCHRSVGSPPATSVYWTAPGSSARPAVQLIAMREMIRRSS